MIIKGGPRAKGGQLAVHLMRTDTNETVRVFDTRGVFSKTVRGAMQEMEGVAAGSKATRPLYHVSINPESDEKLTDAQWLLAAERLEKALGLEGYQRIMVQHLKKDRTHVHVVWCRIDARTLKAAHHSHNYRTHEEVARSLEREFGLKRTQGVHAERDGKVKSERRPKTKESMQETITGIKKADVNAAIAAAWSACRNGAAFKAYLQRAGYQLAAGDRRDFVVLDAAGGVHSIRSGVKGLRIEEIRSRLADLDQTRLPTVAEAKAAILAQREAREEAEQARVKAEEFKRAFPEKEARPVQPTPDRYASLPQAHQTALVNRNIHYRVNIKPPQLTPTPPSWSREATPLPPTPPRRPVIVAPIAPQARPQQPMSKPVAPAPVQTGPSPAMAELRARQNANWHETKSGVDQRHAVARQRMTAHHVERLASFTVEIDQRLKELNGLSSRAGALMDRSERDREIAYLVAKRQRSLADEKARQEKVMDELRRAQEKELEEAKARHDRLAALQQQVLDDSEKRRRDNAGNTLPSYRRPPDYER